MLCSAVWLVVNGEVLLCNGYLVLESLKEAVADPEVNNSNKI